MSQGRHCLSWVVVSTLLFGGHFRAGFDPKVRYENFGRSADVVPLLLAILIVAVLFCLVGGLLSWSGPRGKQLAETGFLIALTQGVLVSLRPPMTVSSLWAPLVTVLVWCGVAVVLWKHWREPGFRLVGRLTNLSLILAPLPVVLVVHFLGLPSVPPQTKTPAWDPNLQQEGRPIVVAIFDEWSPDRTFTNHAIPEWMPRLREIAGQGTVYSDARSPGPFTLVSIPRLLFQTTAFEPNQLGQRLESMPGPHLLDRAPPGYQKAVVGFYLPYLSLLGDDLDYCQAYPYQPKGDRLREQVSYRLWEILAYWQDPWAEAARTHYWAPHVFGPYWYRLVHVLAESAREVLRTMPPNTIAFFHFPFPHLPWVVAEDGSYRQAGAGESADPWIYERSLRQVDRAVGEIVESLKRRGLWDETLLVLSSDHSWRQDPELRTRRDRSADPIRHVPLIVKFPHQREPRIITNRFELTELSTLFSASADE